jgi:hypothetical protein
MQPGGRIGWLRLHGLGQGPGRVGAGSRRPAIDGFPIGGAKPGLDSAFIFHDHLI